MATLEELVVSLTAETTGLRAELANASKVTAKSMKDMEKAIQEFSEKSGSQVSFFQTAFATMTGFLGSQAVLAVVGAVKDAFGLLFDAMGEGIKASIAEENALKRLANSLAISGNYSREAMQGLQDFASAMEMSTGVADDVVASNLAMLSSLTKLDAEGLKAAQKAALDFSAATGKDLESATQMVAKAINGSTDAFAKMGIQISESTDKSTQLNNVLTALNGQFGGAAAGAAQTFGGAVTMLKNAWGNLTEQLATTITQNPVVVAMINEMVRVITEMTGAAQGAGTMMKEVFAKALLIVTEVLGTVAESLNTVFGPFTDKFSKMGDALASVHQAGSKAFEKIGETAAVAEPAVKNLTRANEQLANSYSTMYQEQLKGFAEGLAQKNVLLSESFAQEQNLLKAQLEAKSITEDEYFALRYEAMVAQQETELAQLDAFYATQKGKDEEYQNARRNLLGQQKIEDLKFQTDKTKMEETQNKTRADNFNSTMGTIAQLSKSGNKELAAIGKAAAITQATIDGYAAVQKALAAAPPPFGFALAALVGAATAMNVAKIAGVGLNKGGTVPGGGANRDTVPAMLTGGEEVVNRDTAEKLREFLADGGAAREININVSFPAATIIGDVKSSDFGAMVVEAINEALSQGKSVGLIKGAVA